jgi:hypothetical protein
MQAGRYVRRILSALSKIAIAVALLSPGACFGGSATPQQAIVELLLATNIETAERHLPNSLRDGLRTLTASERQAFEARLRFVDGFRRMGMEVSVPEDGRSLLVVARSDTARGFELRVQHETIGGADAVLELSLEGMDHGSQRALLWMKLEDGEWRVTELEWLEGRYGFVVFDDARFLDRFRNPELKELESSVQSTLFQISYALQNYASTFPEVGYPADLSVLGPSPEEEESSSEHAGDLQQSLAANSFQKDGYEFHYELRRGGKDGAYSIVARPIQYGRRGNQSFYLDETEVIRATRENREPTAEDEPVE